MGAIIQDCWAQYFSQYQSEDGLCGLHLLREMEFIIDENCYAWAKNMKRLLKKTWAKFSKRKRKQLKDEQYDKLQKPYRNILTRGISELSVRLERPSSERGRLERSDEQNLWIRLYEQEYAVLLFAYRAEVPITNYRAERDLRMGMVKQKVGGCLRQEQYAAA